MNFMMILSTLLQLLIAPLANIETTHSTEISVFLTAGTSQAVIEQVAQKIRSIEHVASIKFISKEEELQVLQEKSGYDGKQALEDFKGENNPLPDSFVITVESSKYNNQVRNEIVQLNQKFKTHPIQAVKYSN
jgi:cell division transport system permease protein